MEASLGTWPPNAMATSVFANPLHASPSPRSPCSNFDSVPSSSCASGPGSFGSRNRLSELPLEEGRSYVPRLRQRRRDAEADAFGVPFYSKHILLCHKEPRDWRFYPDNFLHKVKLSRSFAKAIEADEEINYETQLSICEGIDGDALIFPDMIKISGLTTHDVGCFLSDVLKPTDGEEPRLKAERLTGTHVFVACYGDKFKSGQDIVDRLHEEFERTAISDKVTVWRSASFDRFQECEANVIIFSDHIAAGCDWYGGVTVEDVQQLVREHIVQKGVFEDRWLGCMGLHGRDQQKLKESRMGYNNRFSPEEQRLLQQECCHDSGLDSPVARCCFNTSEASSVVDDDMSETVSPLSSEGNWSKCSPQQLLADMESPQSSEGEWAPSPRQKLMKYLFAVRETTERWFPKKSVRSQRRFRAPAAPIEEETCAKHEVVGWRDGFREYSQRVAKAWDFIDTVEVTVFSVSTLCIGVMLLGRRW